MESSLLLPVSCATVLVVVLCIAPRILQRARLKSLRQTFVARWKWLSVEEQIECLNLLHARGYVRERSPLGSTREQLEDQMFEIFPSIDGALQEVGHFIIERPTVDLEEAIDRAKANVKNRLM